MIITLYKTPSPGTSQRAGEYWEIVLSETADGRFQLNEYHGNWDETAEPLRQESLAVPTGESMYFDSRAEGEAAWEEQKRVRARMGFIHGQVPHFDPTNDMRQEPIYEMIVIEEA